MQRKSNFILLAGAIMFTTMVAAQNSTAGASVSEQLRSQYKPVKMGSDSTGPVVLERGTVLVIQKPGILGVPPGNLTMAQHTYADGNLRGLNSIARGLLGKNTRYLQLGEKVYVRTLDIKSEKKADKITLVVMECDSCNGVSEPASYKAEVVFAFPTGYLGTAKAPDIQGVISQVLSIDTASAPFAPLVAPPPPADAATSAPATISVGQSLDQVVAAFGQPQKKADLGTKQIYYYGELKVTFVDGKVANVQ